MMNALKEAGRLQSTETIEDAIRTIGGGHVDTDERMVRAALIDVFVERRGEAAGDCLMNEIGL